MALDRRSFLSRGAAGLCAFLAPAALPRRGAAAPGGPVLVVLFLRGGVDALNTVVPYGDATYYALRPTIQIPPGSEVDLDGFFGLNPALSPLLPLYQSEKLAFVHACGSPDPTRSHFDAQDFMEKAAPGDKSIRDGWLNRFLAQVGGGERLAGIALRTSAPASLRGPAPSLAFASIAGFRVEGAYPAERRSALERRYQAIPGSVLGESTLAALSTVDRIQSIDTATSVVYPDSGIAAALRDAAALIKADIGTRVVTVDAGGWDHHSDMDGRLSTLGADLAASLAAFHEDLGACADTTLTLGMTEFGRRCAENGGGGADHGHGGIMIALGGGIRGGRVLLRDDAWPGLAPEDLWKGKDLAVTTDFRDVFAEVLTRHMGHGALDAVFPGFTPEVSNFPGLLS